MPEAIKLTNGSGLGLGGSTPGARWFSAVFTFALLFGVVGCDAVGDGASMESSRVGAVRDKDRVVRMGFGSCADDDAPAHKVWDALLASDPDALIMMGDNVYADSTDFKAQPNAAVMRAEYEKLAATPGFARLRASRPVFATWDDHDFGLNDGGADFPFKTTAAEIFKDFWQYPVDDPARARAGVYAERRFVQNGIDIQLLMLDTRTFRGRLESAGRSLACPLKNYIPNTTETFLGEAQWRWLEERLQAPADLRLIVSGQQIIADEHCFEKWGNFPHERLRLFRTLRNAGVTNVILLSGDRHLGEISMLPADAPEGAGFDLFEVTSSPLSARSGFGWGETNSYRVSEDNLRESQFGVLDIVRDTQGLTDNPQAEGIKVEMQLHDAEGSVRFSQTVRF